MTASSSENAEKRFRVGNIFTPTTPIDERGLFAGRTDQVRRIVDAISQKGQHAIVFGERGVGKTSLANVLAQFLSAPSIIAPRTNCDSADDFSSLWKKTFSELRYVTTDNPVGFSEEKVIKSHPFIDKVPDEFGPNYVRQALTTLGKNGLLIVIIDEFDRLSREVAGQMADTIKMLSDYAVPVTLVLVGVANTVSDLIQEHASVERALIQIPMPRMSAVEIRAIITRGLRLLEMSTEETTLDKVVLLSQGLPHYTHLLGLYGTREAIDQCSNKLTQNHIDSALSRALNHAQLSIKTIYTNATASPRKENLYGHVLLACALTRTDDLGYFAPASVRQPMSELLGRQVDIPSYARHLSDFTETEKGSVLERTGRERKYRYRFRNPLLQPYVVMRGLSDGLISKETLARLSASLESA